MENRSPSYWFEAKSFGIGWTLPVTWQGWTTVAVYFVLITAGLVSIPSGASRIGYLIVVSALFISVVAWKGDRPLSWVVRRQ